MRWRVWVAVLLLAAVLGGGCFLRARTAALCRELGGRLAAGDFEGSWSLCRGELPFFSAVVTHDRIDALSACYARAAAFRRAGAREDYAAEVQNALLLLSLLMEYDRPSVRSIL